MALLACNCGREIPCGSEIEESYSLAACEAIRRYKSGERPMFSTGIDERLTYGYGGLDSNGFWEFPIPYEELSEADKRKVDLIDGRIRPTLLVVEGYRTRER